MGTFASGSVIRFNCRLTTPFHTSRQAYATYAECAPFVMGSTFRGAVLKHMVETHCDAEHMTALREDHPPAEVHRACDRDECPVKPFFEPPSLCYSFSFAALDDAKRAVRARIGLERETASVAEGAIVMVDVVEPGSPFTASVTLWGPTASAEEGVIEAFHAVGVGEGIGGRRSIGFGQYAVEQVVRRSLEEEVESQRPPPLERPYFLGCRSPLVLREFPPPLSEGREQAGAWLSARLREAASRVGAGSDLGSAEEAMIVSAELRGSTEVISRFSYEQPPGHERLNALVAWPESHFVIDVPEGAVVDLEACVAAASVIGIGEWYDSGFGRLEWATDGDAQSA
jgi:hypothetical protein